MEQRGTNHTHSGSAGTLETTAVIADTRAEQSLLGGLLLGGGEHVDRCTGLEHDHFFISTHQRLYRAILDMRASGFEVSSIGLHSILQD